MAETNSSVKSGLHISGGTAESTVYSMLPLYTAAVRSLISRIRFTRISLADSLLVRSVPCKIAASGIILATSPAQNRPIVRTQESAGLLSLAISSCRAR